MSDPAIEPQTEETIETETIDVGEQVNPEEQIKNDLKGLTHEELIDRYLNMRTKEYETRKESIKRKEKLRAMEVEQDAANKAALEEQNKFKEIYEGLKEETKDLADLRAYKENALAKASEEFETLQNQLTAVEKTELELVGDIPIENKLRWIRHKISSRGIHQPDASRSTKQGGSLASYPTNRRELGKLNTIQVQEFKTKFPEKFKVAMQTP